MSQEYAAVFERGDPVFDMAGILLYHKVNKTDRVQVKPGMMKRVLNYARKQMDAYGFPCSSHEVCVELMLEPGENLSDGYFSVRFKNEKGGVIGVEGIMIKNAWPILDHGFFLDTE